MSSLFPRSPRMAVNRLRRRSTSPTGTSSPNPVLTLAEALLTLPGVAAEKIGLDRMLKVNTAKKRTHSLFRQGLYWYSAIPTMCESRLRDLMTAFAEVIAQHDVFREIFGVI